jgi:hypothetical protein
VAGKSLHALLANSTPPFALAHPDAVPPALKLVGASPVYGIIPADQAKSTLTSAFPELKATDSVTASPAVTCTALLAPGGTEVEVEADTTQFPHGTTVVTCTAKDTAGNKSPAVAFAVHMECDRGYGLSGAVCTSERSS